MPAPRANTVLYHGVLSAHAARRANVVASAAKPPRNLSWAELMQRSFGLDVLACPDCGGRMRYLATIFAADGLHRMLRAKGYTCAALPVRPARGPPAEIDPWI